MRKFLAAAAAILLGTCSAHAQSIPSPMWKSYATTHNPVDILSAPTVGLFFGTKIDTINGFATGLALTGGTLSATDISTGLVNAAIGITGSTALSVGTLSDNDFDVRLMSAKCDGTTDDATHIQNALNYVATLGPAVLNAGRVTLPPGLRCLIKSGLNVPQRVVFSGIGRSASVLAAGVANMAYMIRQNTFSVVQDMEIDPANNGAFTPSSGWAIDDGSLVPSNTIIRNVFIDNPCGGIDVSGNSNRVEDSYIAGTQGTGCGGIRMGHYTTLSATVDTRLDGNTISGNRTNVADYDLRIEDDGGSLMVNDDFLFAKVGIQILPGANQQIDWATFGSSYYGDTNTQSAVTIDTGAATSIIKGLTFNGGWASSAGGSNSFMVHNTGGGTVAGIHLLGMRLFNNAQNVVDVGSGVSNLTVRDSDLCGNGNAATGIYLEAGASNGQIQDDTISLSCDGFTSNSAVGVTFVSANANWIVTGNNFNGITIPLNQQPTGDSVIANNTPLSTELPTVADAATLSLVSDYDAYAVTGSGTNVTNINGAWSGRKILLMLQAGPITFSTGGAAGSAMCNALTPTGAVVEATFYGCWYLK